MIDLTLLEVGVSFHVHKIHLELRETERMRQKSQILDGLNVIQILSNANLHHS